MTSRQGSGGTRGAARPDRSRTTDPGELARPADVAPGVTVTWDPARPYRCTDVTVPDGGRDPADVDALPWLRLAAVTVLDRQLYLPLNRCLLDAEHAAARLDAARTLLAGDPVREFLVRRALVGARAASRGVVELLQRLAPDHAPPSLATALDRLLAGYATLRREVRGTDDALTAVVEEGRRFRASAGGPDGRDRDAVGAPEPAGPVRRGVDRIDPRVLPARVVRLGPTCDAAEIRCTPVCGEAGPSLRVRVDAYAPAHPDRTVDVGVRLVDRRSGSVRGHGLLGSPGRTGRGTPRYFEGLVPLPPALVARDVRTEVFDAASGPPPTPTDDADLRRVRRATLFLADWRALVADVRLRGTRAAPAARLREIGRRAADGTGDGPLWSGGPTRSRLMGLGEHTDRTLAAWLRGGRVPAGVTRDTDGIGAVSGPGDLLVAEVVAAHERSRD